MLMHNFLKASEENRIVVTVVGSRKREVALIVHGKYTALTKDKRIARVLNDELKYTHFEIDFTKSRKKMFSKFLFPLNVFFAMYTAIITLSLIFQKLSNKRPLHNNV